MSSFDAEKSGELLNKMASMIVNDKKMKEINWDSYAVVFQLDRMKGCFDYVFKNDGSWAGGGPDNSFDVMDVAVELRKAMTVPGKDPWKTMLLQIKKPDYKIHADFDYQNINRWKISPGDLEATVERLRPK